MLVDLGAIACHTDHWRQAVDNGVCFVLLVQGYCMLTDMAV